MPDSSPWFSSALLIGVLRPLNSSTKRSATGGYRLSPAAGNSAPPAPAACQTSADPQSAARVPNRAWRSDAYVLPLRRRLAHQAAPRHSQMDHPLRRSLRRRPGRPQCACPPAGSPRSASPAVHAQSRWPAISAGSLPPIHTSSMRSPASRSSRPRAIVSTSGSSGMAPSVLNRRECRSRVSDQPHFSPLALLCATIAVRICCTQPDQDSFRLLRLRLSNLRLCTTSYAARLRVFGDKCEQSKDRGGSRSPVGR